MNEDRDINKEKIIIEDKSILEITNQGKNKMDEDINKEPKKLTTTHTNQKKLSMKIKLRETKLLKRTSMKVKIKRMKTNLTKTKVSTTRN